MEFKGRVEKVNDKSGTSKKTGEPFTAFQFKVVEEGIQYPQVGIMDIYGDKIPAPEVGALVTVSYSLKGQEYEGNLYGKNDVWKIESESAAVMLPPVQQQAPVDTTVTPVGKDGLPF